MNWADFFQNLPVVGWVCVIVFLVLVAIFFVGIFLILRSKDIKLNNVAVISAAQRELYHTEGKNTLDNQTSNAHNILKRVWIDIFDTGKKTFKITDPQELFILEDIARLIEGKLNYEVKNDLTRNHITEKGDLELQRYSDAKATGYYHAVKANLYTYNIQLPNYDLPLIMNSISLDDYKHIFFQIYSNAREIAGGKAV